MIFDFLDFRDFSDYQDFWDFVTFQAAFKTASKWLKIDIEFANEVVCPTIDLAKLIRNPKLEIKNLKFEIIIYFLFSDFEFSEFLLISDSLDFLDFRDFQDYDWLDNSPYVNDRKSNFRSKSRVMRGAPIMHHVCAMD